MVIPQFGNALYQLVHNTLQIVAGAYLQGWTNGTEPPPEGKINK